MERAIVRTINQNNDDLNNITRANNAMSSDYLKKEIKMKDAMNEKLEVKLREVQNRNESLNAKLLDLKAKEIETNLKLKAEHKALVDAKEQLETTYAEIKMLQKKVEAKDKDIEKQQKKLNDLFDDTLALKCTIGASFDSQVYEKHPKNPLKFKGENDPLSNLYHVKEGIVAFTHTFYSVEEAYQYRAAIDANDFENAQEMLNEKNGRRAKETSHKFRTTPAWKSKKRDVMKELVKKKLEKCLEFKVKLQKGYNEGREFHEDTNDSYWAICKDKKGENQMGKILQEIAEEMLEKGEVNEQQGSLAINVNQAQAKNENQAQIRNDGRAVPHQTQSPTDYDKYAEFQPYPPNNPRSYEGQGGPFEAQRGGFMNQRRGYRGQGRSRGRFRGRGFYNRGGFQGFW